MRVSPARTAATVTGLVTLAGVAAAIIAPQAALASTRTITVYGSARATVTAGAPVGATMYSTVVATRQSTPVKYGRASAHAHATATDHATVTATASVRITGRAGTAAALRKKAHTLAVTRARSLAASRAKAAAAGKSRASAQASAFAKATAAARVSAVAQVGGTTGSGSSGSTAAASPTITTSVVAKSATPPVPCGGSPRKADGSAWTCTFDDEFSGPDLDPTKWSVFTSDMTGTTNGPACMVDSPDNVSVSGGTLNLTARKLAEPITCNRGQSSSYTDGEVSTSGKFAQAYGRFSVRAKFPAATVAGLQSSLWLWPQNYTYGMTWPQSGEIDIAEEFSKYSDRVIPYLHYLYNPTTTLLSKNINIPTNDYCMVKNVNAFHDYTLVWTPTTMTIQFDGRTCLVNHWSATNVSGSAPFDQPFFLNLTQALGVGDNAFQDGVTPLPATTQIDYVRIWK